jgi:hypothetical protein
MLPAAGGGGGGGGPPLGRGGAAAAGDGCAAAALGCTSPAQWQAPVGCKNQAGCCSSQCALCTLLMTDLQQRAPIAPAMTTSQASSRPCSLPARSAEQARTGSMLAGMLRGRQIDQTAVMMRGRRTLELGQGPPRGAPGGPRCVVRPQVRRQRQHQLLERLDPLHVARAAAGWGSNGIWIHIVPQNHVAAPSHLTWAATFVPFDPHPQQI